MCFNKMYMISSIKTHTLSETQKYFVHIFDIMLTANTVKLGLPNFELSISAVYSSKRNNPY